MGSGNGLKAATVVVAMFVVGTAGVLAGVVIGTAGGISLMGTPASGTRPAPAHTTRRPRTVRGRAHQAGTIRHTSRPAVSSVVVAPRTAVGSDRTAPRPANDLRLVEAKRARSEWKDHRRHQPAPPNRGPASRPAPATPRQRPNFSHHRSTSPPTPAGGGGSQQAPGQQGKPGRHGPPAGPNPGGGAPPGAVTTG